MVVVFPAPLRPKGRRCALLHMEIQVGDADLIPIAFGQSSWFR